MRDPMCTRSKRLRDLRATEIRLGGITPRIRPIIVFDDDGPKIVKSAERYPFGITMTHTRPDLPIDRRGLLSALESIRHTDGWGFPIEGHEDDLTNGRLTSGLPDAQ